MSLFAFKTILLAVSFMAINDIKPSWGMSDEMLELANMLHASCQEETGVAEDLIVNCRKGDFADDPKLKCYMFCLLSQMAVVDDDGIIDEDGMIAVMPEEVKAQAEKTVRGCGTKKGADPCDNVFLTNKCYYESAPNDYFLP